MDSPIEVRITRDDLVVLSFPGPDRSIKMDELASGRAVNRRYRNRRVGEFLKELDLTQGRSMGISKILRAMGENGSPPPEFETDEDRGFFLIRLPVHERAALAHTSDQVTQLLQVLGFRRLASKYACHCTPKLRDRAHPARGPRRYLNRAERLQ